MFNKCQNTPQEDMILSHFKVLNLGFKNYENAQFQGKISLIKTNTMNNE